MDSVRQGIHFDLDTAELKKYYPKEKWRSAYDDVRRFLAANGFEHEQGSGYHSRLPMTQATAVDLLDGMITAYPWLNKCVSVCTVADVPVTHDFTGMFDKNADIPERAEHEKQFVMAKIRKAKANPPERSPAQRKQKRKNDPEH